MRVLIFSFLPFFLFSAEQEIASLNLHFTSLANEEFHSPSLFEEETCLYGNPSLFLGEKTIRVFLYGEPFIASICEDGIAFAIRSRGAPLQGKVIEPSIRWRPGFRLGAGVHFDHDAWMAAADWTYFRNNQICSIGSASITPLFIDASSYQQIPQGLFQGAKEQWLLSLNIFRFTLSRPYYLSKELGITPLIGAMVGWIDQDLSISYRSNSLSQVGVVAFQTDVENNAWRVGPLVGTRLNWFIRRGVWLEGALQGALLYKRCNARQYESAVGNNSSDSRVRLAENATNIQPWFDSQLGIGWGYYFNSLCNYIEVSLLYESQYFWKELFSRTLDQQIAGSQNRFLNNLGDLSMQSASLRIRLDF